MGKRAELLGKKIEVCTPDGIWQERVVIAVCATHLIAVLPHQIWDYTAPWELLENKLEGTQWRVPPVATIPPS